MVYTLSDRTLSRFREMSSQSSCHSQELDLPASDTEHSSFTRAAWHCAAKLVYSERSVPVKKKSDK